VQRRAQTIQDVLKTPVETGDLTTSKVDDHLQRFVEDIDFLRQLDQTRDAAAKLAARNEIGEEDDGEPIDQAGRGGAEAEFDRNNEEAYRGGLDRATEYAEAAQMLDELYRQLVAPRLARLRGLEQQANRLAQKFGQGGKQTEESESDPETQAGIRQLQRELEEEGLGGLAELLEQTEWNADELSGGFNELQEGVFAGVRTRRRFGSSGFDGGATRLAAISIELQNRIQEMILLEISADRDAPVPAQYRRAVDRYFRILAGQADTDRPTSAMTGAAGNTKPSGAN
jgi:hypothetical protein